MLRTTKSKQNYTLAHLSSTKRSLPGQIWDFILHLRWHYQVFILSGGYLISGLFVAEPAWNNYLWQFVNVHLLLFGGATAYNSYFDKDEGPIGGLTHPPKMKTWMHPASLLFQFGGLGWAIYTQNWIYSLIYVISLLLFWLYSTPHFRWKGDPVKSIWAIALSTGTNSFLMGYLAAGGDPVLLQPWLAAIGVALILVSLYPVSQLFQLEDDRMRGDQTFALIYGNEGIRRFYLGTFQSGALLTSATILTFSMPLAVVFLLTSQLTGFYIQGVIKGLEGTEEEYNYVMKIKYFTSFSFIGFIIAAYVIRYFVTEPIFGFPIFHY